MSTTIYVLKQRQEMPTDRSPTSGEVYWEDVCAVSNIQSALDWNNDNDRRYVILELDPKR